MRPSADPPERFQRLAPTLAPVAASDLDWYLASVIHEEFLVAGADLDAAFAAVVAASQGETERQFWDELEGWEDLDELCELVDTWPEYDGEGNLVGIGWAADGGPFPILEALAPWVREGSFFLLEDDRGTYWKAAFEGGKLVYYGEAVAPDWLDRLRAEGARVRERLVAAGWTLDLERMARDKAEMSQRYRTQERADVDLDCPTTHLVRGGHLELRVSHRGTRKRSWLDISLRERSRSGQLDLCVTVFDRLVALLDEIVRVQDQLSPATWEAWLRDFTATYEPSVHARRVGAR